MAQLKTTESIVLEVLEKVPAARKDDYVLIYNVLMKMNKLDLLETPFYKVLLNHNDLGMPSWETITRCRRKVQEKRIDLIDEQKARYRNKEQEDYIGYART